MSEDDEGVDSTSTGRGSVTGGRDVKRRTVPADDDTAEPPAKHCKQDLLDDDDTPGEIAVYRAMTDPPHIVNAVFHLHLTFFIQAYCSGGDNMPTATPS